MMERLAFVKSVHQSADEQSRKLHPLSSMSVLRYHDAIELYLYIAAEYHDVNQSSKIMDYWNDFKQTVEIDLPHKASIDRLRQARVNLKHYGNRPDERDIESFRTTTRRFLEEATPRVFGIKYTDISLTNLIEFEIVRETIQEAENLYQQNNRGEAMGELSLAHRRLFDEYRERARKELDYDPFPNFRLFSVTKHESLMDDFADSVNQALNNISDVLRYQIIGIDYRRCARFRSLTPTLVYSNEEERERRPHLESYPSDEVTDSDFEFCVQFLVDVALRLQESELTFEYDYESGTTLL